MNYVTKEVYDELSGLLFKRQAMVERHANERIGQVMSLDARVVLQRKQKEERKPLDAAIWEIMKDEQIYICTSIN